MTVWYDLEEVKKAIPMWIPPQKSVYENTKNWYKGLRMEKKTEHIDSSPQTSHLYSRREYNGSGRGEGNYNFNRGGRARGRGFRPQSGYGRGGNRPSDEF